MNRKFLTLKMKVRQFGITSLIIGGILFINKTPFSTLFLVIGALLFVFYYFLSIFDKQKEEPNWELAFPSLALGHSQEQEVEYEQYLSGKERFFHVLYWILRSLAIVSLVVKFFNWSTPNLHIEILLVTATVVLIISSIGLAVLYIISIFSPITQKPNWELVFPELKLKK